MRNVHELYLSLQFGPRGSWIWNSVKIRSVRLKSWRIKLKLTHEETTKILSKVGLEVFFKQRSN
jgi:hypothetical protein